MGAEPYGGGAVDGAVVRAGLGRESRCIPTAGTSPWETFLEPSLSLHRPSYWRISSHTLKAVSFCIPSSSSFHPSHPSKDLRETIRFDSWLVPNSSAIPIFSGQRTLDPSSSTRLP